MNNLDEVIQVISNGLIVAAFLLNTNRFLKAIKLCKECFFILKDKARIQDEKLRKSFYIIMLKACNRIREYTNATKYAEKLLQMYRESGERIQEYNISKTLGEIYLDQSKYEQARQVTVRALLISKQIGSRNGEASCYTSLGIVHGSVWRI